MGLGTGLGLQAAAAWDRVEVPRAGTGTGQGSWGQGKGWGCMGDGDGVLKTGRGLGLLAAVSWGQEWGPGDRNGVLGTGTQLGALGMLAGEWGRGTWWGLGVSSPLGAVFVLQLRHPIRSVWPGLLVGPEGRMVWGWRKALGPQV